jgi:hypothetical protein
MKTRIGCGALLSIWLAFSVGCGGTYPATPVPAPVSSGASVITMGDAPADKVVSFEITINDVKLSTATGVTDVTGPFRLEMTHLSATVEDLAHLNLPAGTYTQAVVTWSSPEVTFVDDLGALHEIESNATGTATIALNNLVVTGPTVLNFDINVAASVTLNTAPATVAATFSPAFTFTAARGVGEVQREPEDGELDDIVGAVVSASPTSLTIIVAETGSTLTFVINANTSFESPITSASQFVAKQIVRVEGDMQMDGTLVAKEVEPLSADGAGAELEGFVTSKAASTFTLITHVASGAGTSTTDLGRTVTIDASTAKFTVSKSNINTGSLTFKAFSDLAVGQQVEVDSDSAKSSGHSSVTDDGSLGSVKKIKLSQQALTGTVSAAGTPAAAFTLTLSASSAFAQLTGATTIQVLNNGAELKNITVFTAGQSVRVRGLLFHDSAGYHLVAARITTP